MPFAKRAKRSFRPCLEGSGGVAIEHLESRTLLTAAVSARAASISVNAGSNVVVNGKAGRAAPKSYRVSVGATTVVDVSISRLTAGASFTLLNANQQAIATTSNGKADASVRYLLPAGTYTIRVQGQEKKAANFRLNLRGTAAPVTVSAPTQAANQTATSGANLLEVGRRLGAIVDAAITNFVKHSAIIQLNAPTIYSQAIAESLVQINSDVQGGRQFQALSRLQTLGRVMLLEAQVVTAYGLPATRAMIAYGAIQQDLAAIQTVKTWTYAYLLYLGQVAQARLNPTAQAVLGTGVIAPPAGSGSSYAGAIAPSTVSNLSRYNNTSLAASYAYYVNHQLNLPSAADYYYDHYDYSGYATFGS